MPIHGNITAKSVHGELLAGIFREPVGDVSVLTDVQVAARDSYDERADLRVLRDVHAE